MSRRARRVCPVCGFEFSDGARVKTCDECAPADRTGKRAADPAAPGVRLALEVTEMRLAIELATCALRLGHPADALAHLEAVAAPARTIRLARFNTTKRAAKATAAVAGLRGVA